MHLITGTKFRFYTPALVCVFFFFFYFFLSLFAKVKSGWRPAFTDKARHLHAFRLRFPLVRREQFIPGCTRARWDSLVAETLRKSIVSRSRYRAAAPGINRRRRSRSSVFGGGKLMKQPMSSFIRSLLVLAGGNIEIVHSSRTWNSSSLQIPLTSLSA